MNQINTKQSIEISCSEVCYYLFFCILFFAKAVGFYDGQSVFKVCLVVAALFICSKLLLTSYDWVEIAAIGILLLLGILVYRNSGEKSALIYIVMMAGLKNIRLERMMKVGLTVWATGFFFVILENLLGIGTDIVMVHEKFGIDILRRGMGYSHPNVLHVSYAILVVLVLFHISKAKSKWAAYTLLFAGNILIFLYSASYTGFMLVTFCILFSVYFSYRRNLTMLEKVLIQAIFPLCVLFALFAPLLVKPDTTLFNILNKVLNQRFYASRLYLQENPVTLWGQRIYASHSFALDSSYVTLFIYGGLVLFLLVCAGYLFAIHYYVKEQDSRALSVLLSFTIAGVIEPFLFNLSFKNLSLLFVAAALFACQQGKKGEKHREISLLSKWDHKFVLQRGSNEIYKIIDQRKRRQTVTAGQRVTEIGIVLLVGILLGTVYYAASPTPSAVYVGEAYCDVEGEKLYVDQADYRDSGDVVFYEYVDAQHGIYRFEGASIYFAKMRDSLMMAAMGMLLCCVVLYGLRIYKQPEENRRRGIDE